MNENRFLPPQAKRSQLFEQTFRTIDDYFESVPDLPVKQSTDLPTLRREIAEFKLDGSATPEQVTEFVADRLRRHQTHFNHPAYLGLFDPASTPFGVVADALVATFNPQLASSFQSVFPIEIEQHLLRLLGSAFGYAPESVDGTFTSGGTEANHTAILAALTRRFPEFKSQGVRSLKGQPVLYVSREAHHSFHKGARLCGLGDEAVREIDVGADLRLRPDLLREQIRKDRAAGYLPFLVGATAGTTKAGAIDPLPEMAAIAREENVWFHIDGAWGGAAAIVPALKQELLAGTELADSITLDAHKWLAVPMGAGLFLSRHPGILREVFLIQTGYIIKPDWDVVEPYQHSIQWSRRFIGLKLFMNLASIGWPAYREMISQSVALGDELRQELTRNRWRIVNDSQLPVVCFVDDTRPPHENTNAYLSALQRRVVESGRSWISTVQLSVPGGGVSPALRAAVVNYRTRSPHLRTLVETLNEARKQ